MVREIRTSDAVLAVFLVAITAMLLLPLPTALLDLLLVMNMAAAVLVLLAGLYMPSALALLSFPSLLLLLTLFRLGLNVASTRLILSQGDAGTVIQSFGDFLISGEVVVGVVIFLIITIVNFVVIARGSARVSEVAARFALDALPGKQLAIDSDLRAGLLSAEEARRRREDLRKESQLYGSMDGAMKFVQGDAVAGLFIIAVNILGGMYMGISRGLAPGQAVHTYTILTVGDGLVNQIPAILVSICAGIVVTRVSSGEHSSLGSDVHAQVLRRPESMMAAGALMLLIGMLPGLPLMPFAVVGTVLTGAGLTRRHGLTRAVGRAGEGSEFAGQSGTGDAGGMMVEPVVLAIDAGLAGRHLGETPRLIAWWSELSRDFFQTLGVKLPPLQLSVDTNLPWYSFSASFGGAVIDSGTVLPSAIVAETNPANAALIGVEVLGTATHPLSGAQLCWFPDRIPVKKVAEAADMRVWRPLEYAALRIAGFFSRHPEEVLSVADVMELESGVEKRYPGLLSQGVNRQFLTSARLTEVLQQLVREGVSIREGRLIIECICSYCSTEGAALVQEGEYDLQDIVGFVRRCRKRQLIGKTVSNRASVKSLLLSGDVQMALENLKVPSNGNSRYVIPQEEAERLRKGFRDGIAQVIERSIQPVAIICPEELRARLMAVMTACGFSTPVITKEEMGVETVMEPTGVWSLGA